MHLVRIITGERWDCDGDIMVDFTKLRKQILLSAEGDEKDDEDDNKLVSLTSVAGWRKELDNLSTTATISLGAGLLGATIFDAIKNRDGTPMFTEPWKTIIVVLGSSSLGFGLGRLSRGTVAQHEAENYERVLAAAEEEAAEAEENEAETNQQKQNHFSSEMALLNDPMNFQLVPSHTSMNVIGDYGPAIGQSAVSYQYGGY